MDDALAALHYDDLQPVYEFTFKDRTYRARLETGAAALAPAYGTYTHTGMRIGRVVLPSGLANVEFFFLEWFLVLDSRTWFGPAVI